MAKSIFLLHNTTMKHSCGTIGKFFRKITFIAFLSGTIGLQASVLYLKNGDRLTGDIAGRDGEKVVLQTSMGVLSVPLADIVRTVDGDGLVPDYAPPAAVTEAGAIEAGKPEDTAKPDPYADLPEWMREYKYFLGRNIPEGWKFWLRGGMEYRKTTSSSTYYFLNFSGDGTWYDVNHFKFMAYYDYTNETSVQGIESTTLDKYGIDTAYRRDITHDMRDPFHTGAEYTWFFENILNYKKDMVKNIRHQVDEAVTVGVEFKFPEEGLKFSVAPGPAVRYISADGYDHHWVFMAVLSEEIEWRFHEIMRLEQKGYMGVNATNINQKSLYFMLGFVVQATDVMDIALRYIYNYDSINSSTNLTTEERFILSFEFPLY